MKRRVLVVHYSRTGTTRALAEAVGDALGCPVEGLRDARPRHGLVGWVRSVLEAILRRTTELLPYGHRPQDYDLVILGTPVWAGHPSTPIRTYVERNAAVLPAVACVCTYDGRGEQSALRELELLVGKRPLATLAVTSRRVMAGAGTEVQRFVDELEAAMETAMPSVQSVEDPPRRAVEAMAAGGR